MEDVGFHGDADRASDSHVKGWGGELHGEERSQANLKPRQVSERETG